MPRQARDDLSRASSGQGVQGAPANIAATIAACLSLLGLLSAAGAWSETLDLLNHATPLYLFGGLTLMAIAGLRRRQPARWALLALGMAGALASGARVVPEALARWSTGTAPPGATVSVLTLNVWNDNTDPHATARALLATGADIILLQELDTPGARTVARDLERAYPYAADCTLVNRWCSLAIVSRLPISDWAYHQGSWRPPDFDRLVIVRATIDSPALGRFDVIDTKLAHPYTGDLQRTQLVRLVDQVRRVAPDRAILAGDFNLTPWSFTLRRLDRSIELVRRTHGLASWPNRAPFANHPVAAPFPLLPIDQVYAGPGWRTVSVRRGPRTGSDHYGVLVSLAPAPR